MSVPVFRFAPSPNGRLHLGHAYSALLNAKLAQDMDGRFTLRIEDIDTTRCKPEFTAGIFEDLRWLGLTWEEPVRTQSRHFGDYLAALNSLKERGLVYPCFCSRGDIAKATAHYAASERPRDPDNTTLYPGTCRHLSVDEAQARIASGAAHAWRLDMQKALATAPGPHHFTAFCSRHCEERSDAAIQSGLLPPDQVRGRNDVIAHPERWGDAVLARKDTPTSYHLSVVVDDALQGITHVVRGKDLEAATDLHVLLQALLALPTPLYHHHDLLTDDAGGKLAKSKGSETLADARARGVSAEEIKRGLGFRD